MHVLVRVKASNNEISGLKNPTHNSARGAFLFSTGHVTSGASLSILFYSQFLTALLGNNRMHQSYQSLVSILQVIQRFASGIQEVAIKSPSLRCSVVKNAFF